MSTEFYSVDFNRTLVYQYMKVLWVTNILFEHHRTMMGIDEKNLPVISGSWLYAAYESAKTDTEIDLHIATVASVAERIDGVSEGNTFHILPGGDMANYAPKDAKNIKFWTDLAKDVMPDVVVLWGAEAKFAYTASLAFKDKPIIVFVQGILRSIVSHFYDGVPHQYQCRTIRDFVDKFTGKGAYRIYQRQLPLEKNIYEMASGVVVENDWCKYQCKSLNPNLTVFRCDLPIRSPFYNEEWRMEKVERYSIFTNAGGATIKGHHILFQALAEVKKLYPQVRLYIPGQNYMELLDNVKRRSGYVKYLKSIFYNNQLDENIVFTGTLTAEQMAEKISHSHIYVMPSMAENHSSSLIEAMLVGAPVISSLVGGVASLIKHDNNGLIYNSLEAETLAGLICSLFNDENKCQILSANAIQMRQDRDNNFGNRMRAYYLQMIR